MTAPDLFSVVPLSTTEQDLPKPENGPYYVATQKGYYVMQQTHWGRTLVPVDEIPTLVEQINSWIWHNPPQLPPEIVSTAWGFFRYVYQLQKTEAMVDITWHPKHGYRLFVPKQDVHHGGVKATRNPEHYQPGSRLVGTIHSHCNFAAYHSGTDTHDADGHDGLHMTIGHVLDDKLDIAVMLSSNGIRWEKVDLDRIVIEPNQIKPADFPEWWIDFVLPPPAPAKPAATTPKPNVTVIHGPSERVIAGSATTQPNPIVRWMPPCAHGKRLEETCPPCGRYPEDKQDTVVAELTDRHTNLDTLVEELHFSDPRLHELSDVAWAIDDITRRLEELGIDFDYEVEESVSYTPPDRSELGGHLRW